MRKKNPLAIEMLLTKIEIEINDLLLIPYLDQATVNYLTMKKRLLNEGREYLLRMSEKGSLFLGHARGKPRLFNSRDESERFFLFFYKTRQILYSK